MSHLHKYLSQILVSMAYIIWPTIWKIMQKVYHIAVKACNLPNPPQSTDCVRPAAAVVTRVRSSTCGKWSSSSEATVEKG